MSKSVQASPRYKYGKKHTQTDIEKGNCTYLQHLKSLKPKPDGRMMKYPAQFQRGA